MLTKAQYRTQIREFLDDPSAKLWSAANLDILTQMTQDTLWSEFLDIDPYFVSQNDSLTSLTSPGYIDADQAAGVGDLTKRLFRIQSITRDQQEYGQVDRRHTVLQGGEVKSVDGSNSFNYLFLGDQIHLFPYDLTTDLEVRYSYYPTLFDGLADGTDVEWPEGHELALVLSVAATAMAKGGREDNQQLAVMAHREVARLKSKLARKSHGPTTMFMGDTAQGWGGQ